MTTITYLAEYNLAEPSVFHTQAVPRREHVAQIGRLPSHRRFFSRHSLQARVPLCRFDRRSTLEDACLLSKPASDAISNCRPKLGR